MTKVLNASLASNPHKRIVEIGERYMIGWRNGEKYPGDIIEIRLMKRFRIHTSIPSGLELSSSHSFNNNGFNSNSDKPEDYEYYVHFPGFDRRLDEWVTYDRIDTSTVVIGSNEENDDSEENGSSIAGGVMTNNRIRKNSTSKRKIDDGTVIHQFNTASSTINGSLVSSEKETLLVKLEKQHDEITKVKNINSIVFGRYEIETWYYSPYPDEYCSEDKLWICEYCLKYMKKQSTQMHHLKHCNLVANVSSNEREDIKAKNVVTNRPPGRKIYQENDVCMYEIDGKDHKIYCQNLCLLSKLFLDHKTLYYDVDPFLFYVLCEVDEEGSHIVGYFSKEKSSQENYNLACILTFPPYQRKGYGKLLISISYELTKRENTSGSPEKPLSDLGKISYRSYWAYVILKLFQEHSKMNNLTINEISKLTGIRVEDILSTLHSLSLIRCWKGQHVIKISQNEIESQFKQSKKIRLCNPDCLTWQPPEKSVKKS